MCSPVVCAREKVNAKKQERDRERESERKFLRARERERERDREKESKYKRALQHTAFIKSHRCRLLWGGYNQ